MVEAMQTEADRLHQEADQFAEVVGGMDCATLASELRRALVDVTVDCYDRAIVREAARRLEKK